MKNIQIITLAFVLLSAAANAQYPGTGIKSSTGISNNLVGMAHAKTSPANATSGSMDAIMGTEKNAEDVIEVDCTLPATPGIISGSPVGCFAIPTTYSIAPVAGATSYIWTVGGGTILGSKNGTSIKAKFGHGGVSVSVKASNSCGLSGTRIKTVTVINCNQFP